MKKWFVTLMVLAALAMVGSAMAAVENGKINLKKGDMVYVCGCGDGCPCETISRKEGDCPCNKPLVKGTVTEVTETVAMINIDGKVQSFKTVGMYQCACGPKCNCDTISQKPGKCGCGVELKEVK
jgi:hypothetical protein